MAEFRGAQNDQVATTKNHGLATRVQQAFMKVRNGLVQRGLHYGWFKVRNLNGNGRVRENQRIPIHQTK